MSDVEVAERRPRGPTDWDTIYRQGTPTWETGRPKAELVRVLRSGLVRPGTALELGCGTGADAIHLARCGFEVTAVDCSPIAIERARVRVEGSGAPVRFVLSDIVKFAPTAGQFDLVYDAGLYHHLRETDLAGLLDVLWRVTQPGSYFLCLAGATDESTEGGPPQVSEDEIHDELGRLFEFVDLRHFRFESLQRKRGYLGWSCLLRRPLPANSTGS